MLEHILPGDIVVSRANGTKDVYIIGKVVTNVVGDKLTLQPGDILATTGRDRAITRGYERRIRVGNHKVWLFDGADEADKVYVEAVQPTTDSPVSS